MSDDPQLDAFARRSDPATSKEAAGAMTVDRLSDLQGKALLSLLFLGGRGQNDDIVRVSGEEWRTITPRMRPLATAGLVHQGAKEPAASGRSQIVWFLTPAGERLARELSAARESDRVADFLDRHEPARST